MQARLFVMSTLTHRFDPAARPATATLHLSGEAGFREAAELRKVVFDAVAASGDRNLVVELEDVRRIDTAAMAVLVEALVATHEEGPTVFLVSPSESVRRVFELAGLEDALLRCFDCWGDLEQAMTV